MMNTKLRSILLIAGGLMTLVGTAIYITRWEGAPYIYTIGATLFALAQLNTPYHGSNIIIKRLLRQQLFGAMFLMAAGALMFFTHKNEWIMSLTIGALIELYTVFRLSHEEEKDRKDFGKPL